MLSSHMAGRTLRAPSFFPLSMSCGSCGSCVGCKVCAGIVALVLTLTTIAAFLGVWNTHNTDAGWVFGTTQGSIALVTFIISIMAWKKMVGKMCPCRSKGACGGCPCGKENCSCPRPGAGVDGPKCSMCGKMPCRCK